MSPGKSSLMLGNKFPFISAKDRATHKDGSLNGVSVQQECVTGGQPDSVHGSDV